MHNDRPAPNDDLLVTRALSGDAEAFAQLFDRYARLVRAVAWDAGNDWATVQDLTQECFLRAYRQLATLRNREHFRYWLTGIARQLVRETRRRRVHEQLLPSADLACVPTADLDESDEREHVLRLVARLPEQERLAIRIFFLSGRNIADTAQFLDLSRSATYEVIKRACGRLKLWLGVCDAEKGCAP
jgi:RNA polymerase sigma-70 factor (ECF subfamily)